MKAEWFLQGGTGTISKGARGEAIKGVGGIKELIKKSGLFDNLMSSTRDPYEALVKVGELYEELRLRHLVSSEGCVVKALRRRRLTAPILTLAYAQQRGE